MSIELRSAKREDAQQLFKWVNDPVSRKYSSNPDSVPWETHKKWFEKKLKEGKSRLLILEDEGKALGQMRFDPIGEKSWEISIGLESSLRGKGFGLESLELGTQYAWKKLHASKILARVRVENLISYKVFQKAGYQTTKIQMEGEFAFYHMEKVKIRRKKTTLPPPLKIHCAGNREIGLGHVKRCLNLAKAYRSLGGENVEFFLDRASEEIRDEISKHSFPVRILPNAPNPGILAKKVLEKETTPSIVLVDRYWKGLRFHQEIKKLGGLVAAIDDEAKESFNVDLLLNTSFGAKQLGYPENCARVFLLGEEFALLEESFSLAKKMAKEIPTLAKKILISMGGSDAADYSDWILHALEQEKDKRIAALEIKLVLGPAYRGSSQDRAANWRGKCEKPQVIHQCENMSECMQWADLAITAAGTTAYETACLGLPSLQFAVAENQQNNLNRFQELGISKSMGNRDRCTAQTFTRALLDLCENSIQRKQMSLAGRERVDGFGARRVANALIALAL